MSGEHAMLGPMTTPRQYRICRRCGEEKPFDEFYRAQDCRDGLRPECTSCSLAAGRRRYQAKAKDPEYRTAVNAANRAWRARNRERARAHQRTYYERHRELIRRKAQEWMRNWSRANPEKRRANEARRRALKRATSVGPVDYVAILFMWGLNCHLCHQPIAWSDLEFDHVIPLSKGGSHTQSNIKPAHRACNRRKYNKSPGLPDRGAS
jgi:5-methylcytosine-specific restriction endonuclease McrA